MLLSYDTRAQVHTDVTQHVSSYPGDRYAIEETWPKTTLRSPPNVPENVARFYEQAIENLRTGRWDAAGAMFRKTLDVSTKLVEPQYKSLTLFKRIENLVDQGALTTAMGEWAHETRLDGNDAVHDEEPETQVDAEAAQKFTEAFLTYVFALPKMVEKNRAKRSLVS